MLSPLRRLSSLLLLTLLLAVISPALSNPTPVAENTGAANTPAKRAAPPPRKLGPRAPAPSARRRSVPQQRPLGNAKKTGGAADKKDYSSFLCPKENIACPTVEQPGVKSKLNSLADWFKVGFECIDPRTELNSCGGCVGFGKGVDCMALPGVGNVGCERGACKVHSCAPGWTPDPSSKGCIKIQARR